MGFFCLGSVPRVCALVSSPCSEKRYSLLAADRGLGARPAAKNVFDLGKISALAVVTIFNKGPRLPVARGGLGNFGLT